MDDQTLSDSLSRTGIRLGAIIEAAESRTADGIRERHGDAFLVFAGKVDDLKPPARQWKPTVAGGSRMAGDGPGLSLQTMIVLPVRHTERTLSPRFVSVGRLAGTNDVVIDDCTISAFHAVFEPTRGGGHVVRDMGSRNGTFVNGTAVPKGATAAVRPGDTVRFGSIVLMFLDAEKLAAVARQAGGVR
jgi:hypothetical protein